MKKFLLLFIWLISVSPITAQIVMREKQVIEKAVLKPKEFDSLSNFVAQEQLIDYKKYIGYKLYCLPKSKLFKKEVNDTIINFLYSKDTTLIIKEGKIPFDEVYIYAAYRQFGDPKKLKGKNLEIYNKKKKEYDETIDKKWTNIYLPHFYYNSTAKDEGTIYGKVGTPRDSIAGKYFTILNIEVKKDYRNEKESYVNLENLEDYTDWGVSLKITLRDEERQKDLYWVVEQARFLEGWRFNPFFLVPYFEKKYLLK